MDNTNMRKTLLCGLLACAAILPARADQLADYAANAQRFDALKARFAAKHGMPVLSDPESASVLKALSDYRGILEARPFTDSDMPNMMATCNTANNIAQSYALFDLGSALDKSTKDPAEAARITGMVASRNVIKYQDEGVPLFAFEIRCLAKALPLLENFAAKLKPEELTPVRRSGLAQLRNGVYTTFVSMALVPVETAVNLRNRREMVAAMVEAAPAFSRALDLDARRRAHDQLASQAGRIPAELAAQYQAIVKALGDTACEGLCRL